MNSIFNLILTLDNLARIPRTGSILFAGMDPNRVDSIAEHSYKVTWLTILLAKLCKKHGVKINYEQLLENSITHDWSEAILLDVPSGSPSYQSYFEKIDFRQLFKMGEAKANKEIIKYVQSEIDLDIPKPIKDSPEHKLLKIADTLALLTEILHWRWEGLRYEWFEYLWANTFSSAQSLATHPFSFTTSLLEEFQTAYDQNTKPTNPFLTKSQFQNKKT